ncbi:MAG: hypothetical protein U0Q16_06580 [Bryobacteraceae bacterium]
MAFYCTIQISREEARFFAEHRRYANWEELAAFGKPTAVGRNPLRECDPSGHIIRIVAEGDQLRVWLDPNKERNSLSRWHYFVDQSAVVRRDLSGPAGPESEEVK